MRVYTDDVFNILSSSISLLQIPNVLNSMLPRSKYKIIESARRLLCMRQQQWSTCG